MEEIVRYYWRPFLNSDNDPYCFTTLQVKVEERLFWQKIKNIWKSQTEFSWLSPKRNWVHSARLSGLTIHWIHDVTPQFANSLSMTEQHETDKSELQNGPELNDDLVLGTVRPVLSSQISCFFLFFDFRFILLCFVLTCFKKKCLLTLNALLSISFLQTLEQAPPKLMIHFQSWAISMRTMSTPQSRKLLYLWHILRAMHSILVAFWLSQLRWNL